MLCVGICRMSSGCTKDRRLDGSRTNEETVCGPSLISVEVPTVENIFGGAVLSRIVGGVLFGERLEPSISGSVPCKEF